jgi:hypothetical protein
VPLFSRGSPLHFFVIKFTFRDKQEPPRIQIIRREKTRLKQQTVVTLVSLLIVLEQNLQKTDRATNESSRNSAASLSPTVKTLKPKLSLVRDHVNEKPVKIYRKIFTFSQELFVKRGTYLIVSKITFNVFTMTLFNQTS